MTESPLLPSSLELFLGAWTLTALVFAGYAAWMVARRRWSLGTGVLLALGTFLVPFLGPLGLAYVAVRRRRSLRDLPAGTSAA